MDNNPESQQQLLTWTGSWGTPPWSDLNYEQRGKRKEWFYHPTHKSIRSKDGAQKLIDLLDAHQGGEPNEDLIMGLRAAAYKVGDGDEAYLAPFADALEGGIFEKGKLDLWAESWMLSKFMSNCFKLMGEKPEYQRIGNAIIEHHPELLVWLGRETPDQEIWKHPLISMAKNNMVAEADALLERVPAGDWVRIPPDFYVQRQFWRGGPGWINGDLTWANMIFKHIPELGAINWTTGMGPLELAAKEHRPHLIKSLVDQGWSAKPQESFGLDLHHWAAFGVSEERWDGNQHVARTPEELQDNIERFRLTMKMLCSLGFDVGTKVEKVDTKGRRRARGMPKIGQDIETYFASRKFQVETYANLEGVLLDARTPETIVSGVTGGKRGMRL